MRVKFGFFTIWFLGICFVANASPSLVFACPAAKGQRDDSKMNANLIREVRHQLVMLPYYSVFDNLTYTVEGDKVILNGQVIRPTLKSDAEAAVKSIEGVGRVVNNIEALPPSPMPTRMANTTRSYISVQLVGRKYGRVL